jgi:hypothetical protein
MFPFSVKVAKDTTEDGKTEEALVDMWWQAKTVEIARK